MRTLHLFTLSMSLVCSLNLLADPYTEMIMRGDQNSDGASKYFGRRLNSDYGSLPLVASKYAKMKGAIAGTGFVISVRNSRDGNDIRRVIVTNSHLLDGTNKRYVDPFGNHEIDDRDVLSCSEDDVAIADYKNGEGKSFGIYLKPKKRLVTFGMNNSPRGYLKYDKYTIGDHTFQNKNFRPIFENHVSRETLSFVQMGNMYDHSCNYFPSAPEHYKGNAIFVPVSSIVEKYTKTPIPYKQIHDNTLGGMIGNMLLFTAKKCHFKPSGKVRDSEKLKQSYFSRNILLPAGIVPGMSGSPLLINNDLEKDQYLIAGIATSYDRKMQTSAFTSYKKIAKCIDQFLAGKRGKNTDTYFTYSSKFKSTYKRGKGVSELPEKGNAGADFMLEDFDEMTMGGNGYGNGGGGLLVGEFDEMTLGGNGYGNGGGGLLEGNIDEMTLGGNGYGNGGGGLLEGNIDEMTLGGNGYGNGGDEGTANEKIEIPTGMLVNGELVIGYNCKHNPSKIRSLYFANWEVLNATRNSEFSCSKILSGTELKLSDILKKRLGNRSVTALRSDKDYNSSETFEVQSKLTVKSSKIELKVYGYYFRKDAKKKTKFSKTIKISSKSKSFQPRVEIPLSGGDSLIVDYRGLFFTDLTRTYVSKRNQSVSSVMKGVSKPKIFVSVKTKERAKGLIPLVNKWK